MRTKFLLVRISKLESAYLERKYVILNMRRIEEHTRKDTTLWIGIQFDETVEKNNFSVAIQLQGENLASHRNIGRHKFFHTGDTIDEFSSEYIVKIKKRDVIQGVFFKVLLV